MPRKALLLLVTLLALAWPSCSYPLAAAEYIKIPDRCRVANRDDHGICWWCCAQTLGNFHGITPLQDITDRVVHTGIGFKTGARREDILHWTKVLGVKPTYHDKKDVKFLQESLARGLPVIVSVRWFDPEKTHAVLLTGLGSEKEHFTMPEGEKGYDYPVHYVNPNDPERDLVRDWTWFYQSWTGRAYTFDPSQQAPEQLKAAMPTPQAQAQVSAQPHRLTVAEILRHPPVLAHTMITPPIELRRPLATYEPHELPFKVDYPFYASYAVVPSNQDIDDGVNRPDDTLRYGQYYYYSPEYLRTLAKNK